LHTLPNIDIARADAGAVIATVPAVSADTDVITRRYRIERGHIGSQDVRLDHIAGLRILAAQHSDADNRRAVDNRRAIIENKTCRVLRHLSLLRLPGPQARGY
jgi:hypothetical protein